MGEANISEVSFVIPCFNGKELFKKYLPPLLKEVRRDRDEVIIVDDCSTDDTVQFLRQNYPFIKVIESAKNRGVAHTINTGFLAARHDYVCLLNSDVLVEEGFLKPLLEHFNNDDVFAVSSLQLHPPAYLPQHTVLSADFKFGMFLYKYGEIMPDFKGAVPLLFCHGTCTVYDKKKFFSLGGLDTMFSPFYWEDFDICFRAWERGWKCLCESASRFRHEQSATIFKKYSPFFIQTTHWKNRFLFMWKNIMSMRYIIGHLVFLVPELVLFPILGKPQFTVGFFKALRQLPEVMRRRREVRGKYVLTDREVIAKFKHIK